MSLIDTGRDSTVMSGRRQSVFSLLREDAALTLEEAAELIGCSMRTIYRYENGEVQPRRSVIRLLDNFAEQASRADKLTSFRFIDLFAGIGGLRLGFESIGGRCVFTSEWDPAAQKTYSMNFRDNHPIAGDIREYSADPDLVPQHDVLLAGFPCQPFSIAGVSKKNSLGRPHGFMCDTQGTLFYDTARIIDHRRPAAFVLENVKNLEGHDQGRTFRTVMHVLENELGYNVQHRVINSAAWVPQKRERIFIVGFRDPTDFDFEALELPDSKAGPKLKSILLPDDEVDPKYTLTERLWEYLKDYRQKHSEKGNGFGYSMFGPEDVSRTLSARYYKDGSEILIEQPGGRPRRLTPRECARLMGFERDGRTFKICVSDTQAYRQFGNSVVVPVVEFVARAMEPHIRKALEKKLEVESGGLEVEAA